MDGGFLKSGAYISCDIIGVVQTQLLQTTRGLGSSDDGGTTVDVEHSAVIRVALMCNV